MNIEIIQTQPAEKVIDISVWNDQTGSWFDLNEARSIEEAQDKVRRYAADELRESGKVSRYQIREVVSYTYEPEIAPESNLTPASLALFLSLAEDAPNWSGTPLVEVSQSEKGNLADLKKKGLLTTWEDEDGCVFAVFTDEGIALAVEHGHDADLLRFV